MNFLCEPNLPGYNQDFFARVTQAPVKLWALQYIACGTAKPYAASELWLLGTAT